MCDVDDYQTYAARIRPLQSQTPISPPKSPPTDPRLPHQVTLRTEWNLPATVSANAPTSTSPASGAVRGSSKLQLTHHTAPSDRHHIRRDLDLDEEDDLPAGLPDSHDDSDDALPVVRSSSSTSKGSKAKHSTTSKGDKKKQKKEKKSKATSEEHSPASGHEATSVSPPKAQLQPQQRSVASHDVVDAAEFQPGTPTCASSLLNAGEIIEKRQYSWLRTGGVSVDQLETFLDSDDDGADKAVKDVHRNNVERIRACIKPDADIDALPAAVVASRQAANDDDEGDDDDDDHAVVLSPRAGARGGGLKRVSKKDANSSSASTAPPAAASGSAAISDAARAAVQAALQAAQGWDQASVGTSSAVSTSQSAAQHATDTTTSKVKRVRKKKPKSNVVIASEHGSDDDDDLPAAGMVSPAAERPSEAQNDGDSDEEVLPAVRKPATAGKLRRAKASHTPHSAAHSESTEL